MEFVIPGLTKLALACPVLDTGYLIRGNPVCQILVPCFRRDDVWIPAGVYPVLRYGAGMTPFALINAGVYRSCRIDSLAYY
jgi:hypothetical protein